MRLCDLCEREFGWDERLLEDEQTINLGRLGKMKLTLSLRGDDIPEPKYSLIAAVEFPQHGERETTKVVAEIETPIRYCPLCGAKLFEDETDKAAREKRIDEFVSCLEEQEVKS